MADNIQQLKLSNNGLPGRVLVDTWRLSVSTKEERSKKIIEYLKSHPGSTTSKISVYLGHQRSDATIERLVLWMRDRGMIIEKMIGKIHYYYPKTYNSMVGVEA